ncbi:hypothetical protein RQP46_008041 [Phenoliferia psychrophenolica]
MRSTQFERLISSYQNPTAPLSLTLKIKRGKADRAIVPPAETFPTTVVDLRIVLTAPNVRVDADLLPFFAKIQNLHRLTFDFCMKAGVAELIGLPTLSTFLKPLAGALPASIERLGIKNVGTSEAERTLLSETPFIEILEFFSNDRLPNLARIDFPNCKRKDLEDEAAAADLLAECERKSIRIVCWEESL